MKQFIKEKLAGRTQRWLCHKILMNEVDFSNSVNGYRAFKKHEWDRIVECLQLTQEDLSNPIVADYKFSLKED